MNPVLAKLFGEYARGNSAKIPWETFIDACLYDAEFGYYRKDKLRVGGDGADFYTSVSLKGRVFSELIAEAAAELAKNPPEVLINFGGTNDSWSGAPVGSIQWENWADEDLKKVLPAFCYLLCRVKKVLPKTQTAVIINTELKPEIESGMTVACEKQGIEYIKLENISKQNGHPDKEGMKQICSQVLSHFS